MQTLHELKDIQEQQVSALIKETKMFFAFSNEQFEKSKTSLEDGEKYVNLGAGCFIPKFQVNNFLDGTEKIKKEFSAAVKANKGMRKKLIAYELANHEAWYTGEIDDTMSALGAGYTKKEVWAVWQENKEAMQD